MTILLLAQHLKELRDFHQYTQEYVSSQLNIERPSYSNYELGKRTPTLDLVIAFADFYNVSVDDLLRNPDFTPCAATSEESLIPNSDDERELLATYRLLSQYDKEELLDYIKFKKSRRPL